MSELNRETMMSVYPGVLDRDELFNALGRTAAEALGAAFIDADKVGIYTRISELDESVLDILAKDFNIGWYDYDFDLATKRRVVAAAFATQRVIGTAGAVELALGTIWPEASIEEWFDYGSDPYNFRLHLPGSWTQEGVTKITWLLNAIKNARSIPESYIFEGKWPHNLFAGGALYTDESGTYQIPYAIVEDDWYIDEDGYMLLDEDGILLTVE